MVAMAGASDPPDNAAGRQGRLELLNESRGNQPILFAVHETSPRANARHRPDGIELLESFIRSRNRELPSHPRDGAREGPAARQREEPVRETRGQGQVMPGHLARVGEGGLEPEREAVVARGEFDRDRRSGRTGMDADSAWIEPMLLLRVGERVGQVLLFEKSEREQVARARSMAPQIRKEHVVTEAEGAEGVGLP